MGRARGDVAPQAYFAPIWLRSRCRDGPSRASRCQARRRGGAVPPPASQATPPTPSIPLLLALVCASIVAEHDPSWLARPVAQLIPEGGPRADRVSRLKARLRGVFLDVVEGATRRGRRSVPRDRDPRA